MSSYTIIHDTTLELRRQIVQALVSAPDADLEITENEITFAFPTNELVNAPRLSIYLYHIEPDANLRNQKRLDVGQNGQRFPPLALGLHYLITPLDGDEPVNHLLLGRILQYFHDNPLFTTLNGTPLDNSFGGNSTQFRILLEVLSMEQLAQIWAALNADYRLAIAYHVRIVAIDSDQGVAEAHRVVSTHPVVGLLVRRARPDHAKQSWFATEDDKRMTLRAVDTVVTNQALITGNVTNALTNLPTLTPPSVSLVYQATATRPQRPYPLTARVYASGLFVIAGSPYRAFPQMAAGETLALALNVNAAGYQPATHNFTLNATELQRQPATITVDGAAVPVTVLNAPLLVQNFALFPFPVHLAGRVVEADNRDKPIANAEVRIIVPSALGPATTNADGFFTLHNLPVALTITVRVTHAGFDTLETALHLDYSFPVNRHLFALTT